MQIANPATPIANPDVNVYVRDIANPGYGPILAVHVMADREYALTDSRALFADPARAERFARKVRAQGTFNPDLWEHTTMTEAERADHWYEMAEWEHTERLAGRDW
jgi:hypothetical protein